MDCLRNIPFFRRTIEDIATQCTRDAQTHIRDLEFRLASMQRNHDKFTRSTGLQKTEAMSSAEAAIVTQIVERNERLTNIQLIASAAQTSASRRAYITSVAQIQRFAIAAGFKKEDAIDLCEEFQASVEEMADEEDIDMILLQETNPINRKPHPLTTHQPTCNAPDPLQPHLGEDTQGLPLLRRQTA